ncbi:MAG TPA: hypothetical protein VLG71_01025 [Candidatus Limnocylindria bacterium]|nr:hypothetical protein [Candidatus Limnocylindria bacterium]
MVRKIFIITLLLIAQQTLCQQHRFENSGPSDITLHYNRAFFNGKEDLIVRSEDMALDIPAGSFKEIDVPGFATNIRVYGATGALLTGTPIVTRASQGIIKIIWDGQKIRVFRHLNRGGWTQLNI